MTPGVAVPHCTLGETTATGPGGTAVTITAVVPVMMQPLPSVAVVSPSVQCGTATPGVMVSHSSTPGNLVRWYLVASGGSPLAGHSNDTLANYPITALTTFYVAEFNPTTGCESPRTVVQAKVSTPDPVVAVAAPTPTCPFTTVLGLSHPVVGLYSAT